MKTKLPLLIIGSIFLCVGEAAAYHNFFFRSANDIITGTLDPARLDHSSVAFKDEIGAIQTQLNFNVAVNPFNMVVGTQGTPNVNAFITTANQFDLILNTFAARGTTSGTVGTNVSTVNATIAFRPGVYDMQGATIPVGIIAQGVWGSSTVWNFGNINQVAMTIYGTVRGITFDFGNVGFNAPGIRVSSGAVLEDCAITGGQVTNRAGDGSFLISALRASTVTVRNVSVENAEPGTQRQGGIIYVSSCTNVLIDRLNIKNTIAGSGGDNHILIAGSTGTRVENSTFNNMKDIAIRVYPGSVNTVIMANKFHIVSGNAGGTGSINIDAGNSTTAQSITTMTWLADNEFYYYDGTGQSVVRLGSSSSSILQGFRATGNTLWNYGNSAPTFFTVDFSAQPVFTNNALWDKSGGAAVFINDSGSQTKFTGLGNMRNNVEN